MRLSISNFAWDPAEDAMISAMLQACRVDAIELAPGKYFPDLRQVDDSELSGLRRYWETRGIEIVAMQGLLFGRPELNLFGQPAIQTMMLEHFAAVCRIGAALGARRLVFGAPRNRDRTGLDDDQAMVVAHDFLTRLALIADSAGVVICLEPNPTIYGANFMTNSVETAQVVARVAHPAIRMQFDTGAVACNREDPSVVLREFGSIVGHVHASEPGLVRLGDGGTDHERMAEALRALLPQSVVSIEMLASPAIVHEDAVAHALELAIRCYRPTTAKQAS